MAEFVTSKQTNISAIEFWPIESIVNIVSTKIMTSCLEGSELLFSEIRFTSPLCHSEKKKCKQLTWNYSKQNKKLFTYVTLNVHTKTSPDPPDTKPL